VRVSITNFAAEGEVTVHFADAKTRQVTRDGDQITVHVPVGAFTGPITVTLTPEAGGATREVEAASTEPFEVLGPPQIFDLKPSAAFAPRDGIESGCSADEDMSGIPLPEFDSCETPGGSRVLLFGQDLGAERDTSATSVELSDESDPDNSGVTVEPSHTDPGVVEFCVPAGDTVNPLWTDTGSSW